MVDWTSSMQQTFEYYVVDPYTWKDVKKLDTVLSCAIERDSEVETLGSATIDVTGILEECYVRPYLITIQNGVTEKHPLGAFLVQSPSSSYDGKIKKVSMDAYTPLLELKEKMVPIGYSVTKDTNILDISYRLVRENVRAPVVKNASDDTLHSDFVSYDTDTWLTFLADILSNAKYHFDLDEMGRVLFAPNQNISSLSPVWTYSDNNSSILYPDLTFDKDLYGVPNVVEVVYSSGVESSYAKVVNDDSNSPTSTVSRGREIVYRDTNPSLSGEPTTRQLEEYAKQLLSSLSTVECTVSYSHGYCPVRVGDCVRINHPKAGLNNVKAKVISQSIKCTPGCQVSERAVFTTKLWG